MDKTQRLLLEDIKSVLTVKNLLTQSVLQEVGDEATEEELVLWEWCEEEFKDLIFSLDEYTNELKMEDAE